MSKASTDTPTKAATETPTEAATEETNAETNEGITSIPITATTAASRDESKDTKKNSRRSETMTKPITVMKNLTTLQITTIKMRLSMRTMTSKEDSIETGSNYLVQNDKEVGDRSIKQEETVTSATTTESTTVESNEITIGA